MRLSCRHILKLSTLLLAVFASGVVAESATPVSRPLAELAAASPGGWRARSYPQGGAGLLAPLKATAGGGLELPLRLPGASEFVLPLAVSPAGWDTLEIELRLPAGMPAGTQLFVFAKDWDHLWRQTLVPSPPAVAAGADGKFVARLPLTGAAARQAWVPRGHGRPWHTLTPRQLIEIGCVFFGEPGRVAEFAGAAELLGARLAGPASARPLAAPQVEALLMQPERPRVGEACEWSFELAAAFADPFAAESVAVSATLALPDGGREELKGFWFEDFLLDNAAAGAAGLRPHGHPRFCLRYTPLQAGPHEISIRIALDGKPALALPPWRFAVGPAAPEWRGFVGIDPLDRRFFRHADGTVFNGIGMNVRSPVDTRYLSLFPFSNWRDEGLALYRRLFARYRECGINVVEVWMSSWWLALEWIPDAPGNHGVGHMNQYRAWMLDHLLALAAEHGIRLVLVINNHGKFGTLFDSEWGRNPFNRKNGGFLDSCEEYFSDARARTACRRLLDYIVARWGHSPQILAWKLFTEIDLTGTTHEFYRQPVVADWHREMAAHLRAVDRHRRPVTTHWMLDHTRANPEITGLPELELLTFDAYYKNGGTRRMLEFFRGTAELGASLGKPVLITEFGGTPYGDSAEVMLKQARLGIWAGFFTASPVAPMFWWFPLVDEHDRYADYRALAKFMAGEDRRGLVAGYSADPAAEMELYSLAGEERALVWGFDARYFFDMSDNPRPRSCAGLEIQLPDSLKPGRYSAEFWNCSQGVVVETRNIEIGAAQRSLVPPTFEKDFALKLRRLEGDSGQK